MLFRSSYHIENSLTWGAPLSVSFTGTPSPRDGVIGTGLEGNFPSGLFTSAASSYLTSIGDEDEKLSALYDLALSPGEQEAAVGLSLAVSTLSGVPISCDPKGIIIDADLATATPVGKDQGTKRNFTLSSGLSGSHSEHATLEASFSSEAISTEKIFQLSNQGGIPILTLTSSNWASESQNLNLPSYVKGSMANSKIGRAHV